MSDLINEAAKRSLTPDRAAIIALMRAARYVIDHNIPGDVVECGVYRGGSAAVVARAAEESDRLVWLYDTFKGIPAPGPVEVDGHEAQRLTGSMRAGWSEAQGFVRRHNPTTDIRIIPGDVRHTMRQPGHAPDQVSLLHVDTDWYDCVLQPLLFFHDRLSHGAVVIIDDFGYWEGARRAFYAYCAQTGACPLIERVGRTQAAFIVGREHNRSGSPLLTL